VKQTIYWLARQCGLFALCRWLTRKDLRILCYHGIWLGGEKHFGNFLYMSPDKFARRMALLENLGYPVVGLGQALEQLSSGTLKSGTTAITIDDGWYGTYTHMLPALERHGFRATLYLTSYYSEHQTPVYNLALHYLVSETKATSIDLAALGEAGGETLSLEANGPRAQALETLQAMADQKGLAERAVFVDAVARALEVDWDTITRDRWFHLMSTAEVRDAAERGLDIQLHTHRHRTSAAGRSTLERELEDNREVLQPLVNNALEHFCYPSGLYQRQDWPALEAGGVVSATTTEAGLARPLSPPYALPRLLDGQDVSDLEFEAELSGFGEIRRRLLGKAPTIP